MKKIFVTGLIFMTTIVPCFAKMKDNIFIIIANVTPVQTTNSIYNELSKLKIDNLKLDAKNNIVFTSDGNIYYKAYPNDTNTELYVISNTNSAVETNHIIQNISSKTFPLKDKDSLKKYEDEYLSFVKENHLNNKISNNKTNSVGYREYNPYMGNLRNKVIEKQKISQDNIEIKRTQLQPKCKVKHYANEYVYEITNNTGKDIIINSVASSEIIGLSQIAAYTAIPRGMDFVPIWGLVYGIQTDLEKNKFTRPHPINEIIKNNSTMRVLALSKKTDNPIVNFYFTKDDKQIKFIYEPNNGEKL